MQDVMMKESEARDIWAKHGRLMMCGDRYGRGRLKPIVADGRKLLAVAMDGSDAGSRATG